MPRFQHALYMMTKNHDIGPTFAGNMRGGNAPPLKLSLYWQLPNVQRGWHSPDLGGPYSIRVIVADLGMVGKKVSGLCRWERGQTVAKPAGGGGKKVVADSQMWRGRNRIK
jgi:hypothetical protein